MCTTRDEEADIQGAELHFKFRTENIPAALVQALSDMESAVDLIQVERLYFLTFYL